MTTLKAEKRNPEIKAKKLRREGFITGVLLGKDMTGSVPLQFKEKDASHFIKTNKEGAQTVLEIGAEKTSAIVKNIDYDSMKGQILSLDFQALVSGEMISATVQIKLVNKDYVIGAVDQKLTEIHYKAEPANLLDTIEIDFKELPLDMKNFYVKDLELGLKKAVDIVTPGDTLVFHITDLSKAAEEESEDSGAEGSEAGK